MEWLGILLLLLLWWWFRRRKNPRSVALSHKKRKKRSAASAVENRRHTDDEKHKTKQKPKAVKISEEQELDQEKMQAPDKVIDEVKPIGFWTRFVHSQNVNIILSRLHVAKHHPTEGYWQQWIRAQKLSEGKRQKKGRQ